MVKTQKDWVIRSQAPNGFFFYLFLLVSFCLKTKKKEKKKKKLRRKVKRKEGNGFMVFVLTMSLRYSLFPF